MMRRCETAASLGFASCYVYSPLGRGPISVGSRVLRNRLKIADPQWLPRYAARVRELAVGSGRYGGMFGPTVVLVPVPRSHPSRRGSVWPAERIADELVRVGLAADVWRGLQRTVQVRKSATSLCGRRPTVREHYESFIARSPSAEARQMLLVDDFVTKGRTLLAAAMRLRERCPGSEVRAFALARTMGFLPGIEHLVAPCEGEILWDGEDACRRP